MKVKKTVGLPYKDGERKSYTIHTTCGQLFFAHARGSQGYVCNDVKYASLKVLKEFIELTGDTEPTEASMTEGADTWDCVHPCALLIEGLDPKWPTPLKTLTTLDAYGWLDCVGRPDVARAEREIKRVQNLNKDN